METLSHQELLTWSDMNRSYEELAVPLLTDSNSNLEELRRVSTRFSAAMNDPRVTYVGGSLSSSGVEKCLGIKYVPLLLLSDEIPKQLLQVAIKHNFVNESDNTISSRFLRTRDKDLVKFITAFTSMHYSLGKHIPYLIEALRSMINMTTESATLFISGEGVLGVMVEHIGRDFHCLSNISSLTSNYNYLSSTGFRVSGHLTETNGGSYEKITTVKVRNIHEVVVVISNLNQERLYREIKLAEDQGRAYSEDSFVPVELSEEASAAISKDLFEEGKSIICIKNPPNGKAMSIHRVYEGYTPNGNTIYLCKYNTVLDLFLFYEENRFSRATKLADTNPLLSEDSIRQGSLSVASLRSGELYVVKYGNSYNEYLVKYWKTKELVVVDRLTPGCRLMYSGVNFGNTFMMNDANVVISRANSADAIGYQAVLDDIYRSNRESAETNFRIRLRHREDLLAEKMSSRNNQDLATQLFSRSLYKVLVKLADENSIAKTLAKLSSLGYYKDSTRNITIKSDLSMTYTPAGKEVEITDKHRWSSKGRQSSKYGKLIRKVLSEQVPRKKFTDHEIERLVNSIKGEYNVGTFNIVDGEDIRNWYDGSNHYNGNTGTLSSSCMRHAHCLPWLNIYTENPNQVKLVILTKGGQLKGRALLWENKWLDRIYGTDVTISAFKRFAREKGFWYKEQQDSSSDRFLSPDGNGTYSSEDITINLDHVPSDDDGFPYLDTFSHLDTDSGELSGYLSGSSVVELRSTEGGHSNLEDRVYDDLDERYIDAEDSVYIEDRGIYTHVENSCYCEYTEQYVLHDEVVETLDGRYVSEACAIYVEYNSGYVTEDEIVEVCAQSNTEFAIEHSDYEVTDDGDYVLSEYYEEYLEESKESE